MPRRPPKPDPELQAHKEWLGYLQPRGLVVAAVDLAARAEGLQSRQDRPDPHPREGLDRRSQQLLTRLRARVAAGEAEATHFRPGDLEEWFAISPTTAQVWLRVWQEAGLLEPARPGQRIGSWQLREPGWRG